MNYYKSTLNIEPQIYRNNTINIVFICDENYALCTGVAIYSLKENRNMNRHYKIYVLCDNVSQSKKESILEIGAENFEIEIINLNSYANYSNIKRKPFVKHVSTSALFKINIAEILENVEKALYIDGDVIIRDNLEELYDINVDDCYAAVCKDIGAETYPAHYNERLKTNLNLYFNSGVMLLNLTKIRNEKVAQKLRNYINKGINHYMDQDAFNVVFNQNVKCFSFLYNMALSCWKNNNNEILSRYYGISSPSIEFFFNKAKIIHFSSPEKPWMYNNVAGADEWFLYFIKSPMKSIELYRVAIDTVDDYLENEYSISSIKYHETTDLPNDEALISVIIPVYNSEKYLVECIESLLLQSFRKSEFIFVDDGSTDKSLEILEKYRNLDSRILVLKQKNSFAGVARNNGLKHASGKYVTFLDSDDIMLHGALEDFYKRAEETHAEIIISAAFHFADNLNIRKNAEWCLRKEYLPEKDVFSAKEVAEKIFQISAGAPWGKFYLKQFLDDNRISFPSLPRSEDVPFTYWALALANRISVLDEKTVLYRIIDGSNSLEETKDKLPLAGIDCRVILGQKLKELDVYDQFEQSYLNDVIDGIAYNLRTFKTYGAFEKMFNEVKYNLIPRLNIDLNDESYFYKKNNLPYIKTMLSFRSCNDYIYYELVKAKETIQELRLRDKKKNKIIEKLERNKSRISNSNSYKVGKFITFIPRYIKKIIKYQKKNGIKKTVHKIIDKLANK